MNQNAIKLLLADDDLDDCMIFQDALDELPIPAKLQTVHDGEQLISLVQNENFVFPDMLFLDLNMPRKSGMECLAEIKASEKFNTLPVVIYSTSVDPLTVKMVHDLGANYYLRKPGDYEKLKTSIHEAIALINLNKNIQPPLEKFVLKF